MENGTQEGKVMREWLDQMSVIEEQVQAQQPNQRQKPKKSPQDQLFDSFVESIVKEFLAFMKQKQGARAKQQQQKKQPAKPPGFNPVPGAAYMTDNMIPPQVNQQQ